MSQPTLRRDSVEHGVLRWVNLVSVPIARKAFVSLLLVWAMSLAPVQAQDAKAAQIVSRRDREAQKLFAQAFPSELQSSRCLYDTVWSPDGVPEWIAATEFRLPVYAGLNSPDTTGDFRAIVNPDRRIAESAFCSQADLKQYTAQRVAEFETGSEERMQTARTSFSYPIFDRAMQKAIIIVSRSVSSRSRSKGITRRNEPFYREDAHIYRKAKGLWRLLRTEMLFVT